MMDPKKAKEALTKHVSTICKTLNFCDIKDRLIQQKIITFDQMDIINDIVGEQSKIMKCIELLMKSDLKTTFKLFLNILPDINKDELRERIMDTYKKFGKWNSDCQFEIISLQLNLK